jgi:KUP system potassium uptake protein
MALTLGLTLGFRSSDNLAAAFCIAVSLTIAIDGVVVSDHARDLALEPAGRHRYGGGICHRRSDIRIANMMKVLEGGWVPLVVAALVFFLMHTWWRGRRGLLGCWNATPPAEKLHRPG